MSTPAEASWDWSSHVPTVVQAPERAQTGANGYAAGGYPNYWTLCVANGYGPTAGVINNWNDWGYRLHIAVQNRCDGYSITNRMTIDNVHIPNGSCITFGNTQSAWSPARGKQIWTNNLVAKINTAEPCFSNNVELYHNIQRAVGYWLGLAMNLVQCLCIQGSGSFDVNNIPYVTNGDVVDAVQGVGY